MSGTCEENTLAIPLLLVLVLDRELCSKSFEDEGRRTKDEDEDEDRICSFGPNFRLGRNLRIPFSAEFLGGFHRRAWLELLEF